MGTVCGVFSSSSSASPPVALPVKRVKTTHESGSNPSVALTRLSTTVKSIATKGGGEDEENGRLLKRYCLEMVAVTQGAQQLDPVAYDDLLSAISTLRTQHPAAFEKLSPLLLEARLLVEEKIATASCAPAVIVRQRSLNSVLHPVPPSTTSASSSSKRFSKLVASPSDVDVVGGLFTKDNFYNTICLSSSNDEEEAGSEDEFGFYDVEVADDEHEGCVVGMNKPAAASSAAGMWPARTSVPRQLRYDAAQLAEGRQ